MSMIILALVLGTRTGLLGSTSNTMLRGLVPDAQLPKVMSMNYSRDLAIDLIGATHESLSSRLRSFVIEATSGLK